MARTSVDISNAAVSRQELALFNHLKLKGAELGERKAICSREDLSEFEQQIFSCPKARDGNGGTVKRLKKVKGKRSTGGVDGERLSEIEGVNAGIHGASMETNPHGELADVGRTTCKSGRRKKIDREILRDVLRLQEEVSVRGSYSKEEGGVLQSGYSVIEQQIRRSCRRSARGSSNDQYKHQEAAGGGRRGSFKCQAIAAQHSEKDEGGGHVLGGYSVIHETSCSSALGSSNDQYKQQEEGGAGRRGCSKYCQATQHSEQGVHYRGFSVMDQSTSCSRSARRSSNIDQQEVSGRGQSCAILQQYPEQEEEGGVVRGLSLIHQNPSCSTAKGLISSHQASQYREPEGGGRGGSSQYNQHSSMQEEGGTRESSEYNQHSIQEEESAVRGSLHHHQTSSSCNTVGMIHSQHLPCIISDTNFDVKYNESYFDEYHKSKASLVSANKLKHFNDQGNVKAAKNSKVRREAETVAAAAHQMDHSPECRSFAAAESNHEEFSLMRLLIKRRAAREAAAAAAIEAAWILETGSPTVVCSSGVQLDNTDMQRREKLSAGRSEAGGSDFMQIAHPTISVPFMSVERSRATGRHCIRTYDQEACPGKYDCGCVQDSIEVITDRTAHSRCATSNARAHDRGICMQGTASLFSTVDAAGGMGVGGMQLEVCSGHAGSGKNTTAAILQDVICALNADHQSTPGRDRPRHHNQHQSDDDGGTPSTADGQDTESTCGGCSWAAASQPSPVSVLISPFDDDASPAGDHDKNTCWIQSEEDYVAALLAATSDSEPTALPPAELFSKLEERVETTWSDSEVLPTRGYRRLVFDCVREALGEAAAYKEGKGNRRWRARVLFEEMCRWRQDACERVLDDLVEADLGKPCNRWSSFEVQTRDIALLLERTIFSLLVEELVCDLVLNVAS